MNKENNDRRTLLRDKKPESVKLKRLLNAGFDVLGDATSAATGIGIGFVLDGPVGAIAGSVSGPIISRTLRWVGQEFSSRHLSKREESRAGCVLVLAAAEICQKIENGERVRQDGFFDQDEFGRSGAEEVVENLVMKCQREPQEKKIPFMGYLLANLVFRDDISIDMAHQIIKLADELTFRQLCLLRIAAQSKTLDLRGSDYRGQGSFSNDLYQVLYECLDLYTKAFVNFGGEVAFGPTDVHPGQMVVQGMGSDIHNLMQLWEITDDELSPIIKQLR